MKDTVLLVILRVAKAFGVFSVARKLTGRDLRILAYHGAALQDEHWFRPGLYMTEETFAKRMRFLADHQYPVIGLEEALERLKCGTLPRCATVITIDDGWYGTYFVMAPILHRHRFPATLYVSSYYLEKQTQVFNVAADFVLWRARDRVLDLSRVADGMAGSYVLADQAQREEAVQVLKRIAEGLGAAEIRQHLLRKLCEVLEVDWRRIEAERLISFMNMKEAGELLGKGIDIQLHTHRHRFPNDSFEHARMEIEDNRRPLSRMTNRALRHFCYPSGEYTSEQVPWLQRLEIASAVTTERGFNRRDAAPYELRRILDAEGISALKFEAEMSGFLELIRRWRSKIGCHP